MDTLAYKSSYRRHLPHYQPPGATLFITFHLANSLPVEAVKRLLDGFKHKERIIGQIPDSSERDRQIDLAERLHFGEWDSALDTAQSSPAYLKDQRVADLVAESLHYRDGKVFSLDAFCIMPNHVHLVCKPLSNIDEDDQSISAIMHSLKLYTARQANQLLGRTGEFWQHESYDRVVRDEGEWRRILLYVVNNPVKAGLVDCWKDWQWKYCRYEM